MTKEITATISWAAYGMIERHAEITGSTVEAVAADVLTKHFEAEALRKEIPHMSDNAWKLLRILAKSKEYVSRVTLVEQLDIKNNRGLSYVLAYMTTYSDFGFLGIVEECPAGLRLPDHLREVVQSVAKRESSS